MGCFQFGSMNTSTIAIKYVSFPFVVLAKSAKVIPIILMGAIRGVYNPSRQQYFIAVFISLGLFIFNFFKGSSKKDSSSADFKGILLLLGSLTFDGLTGTQTDKQHKETKRDFAYPGMLVNNLVGMVLCGAIYVFSVVNNGEDSHIKVMGDSSLLFDCIMVGLAGSLGQVCIFFCISVFDCYLVSVITTTRKFFSVVYSNFRFGHNFNNMQWFGACIVMMCTALELTSKKKSKVETKDDKDKKK